MERHGAVLEIRILATKRLRENRRGRGAEREGDDALRQGQVEEPGTMVVQKSGTNRVILNTGWTGFKPMPDYKEANVIVVPAMNTSRTCLECGAVEAANSRARDDFACLDLVLQPMPT